MAKTDRLKKIKSGALSRGLALAKISVSAGARAAGHAVGNLFGNESERESRIRELLLSQVSALTRELGQLKGSLMKVGQMLSVFGENLFPPEVNAVLKSLQASSPPLAWAEIEKVLKRQLGPEKLGELEIDREPIASASLGQVHRARRKSGGPWLAVKIQYPGVDQAIESDLKALRSILSVSKLIPKGPDYDGIFAEIREMLHREVDYARELKETEHFRAALAGDERYVIAETVPEFSSSRVLTTLLQEGFAVDSAEVLALPQERRDRLAAAVLELYFRELFVLRRMQTDPHFGNYRVQLGPPDRLVLFDFGAVKSFSNSFVRSYRKLIRGGFYRDRSLIEEGARELDWLRPGDSEELRSRFVELVFLLLEPFLDPENLPSSPDPRWSIRNDLFDSEGNYDWSRSDLPKRATVKAKDFVLASFLRSAPRDLVFLDRKVGGVFIFLNVLKSKLKARKILEPFLVLDPDVDKG